MHMCLCAHQKLWDWAMLERTNPYLRLKLDKDHANSIIVKYSDLMRSFLFLNLFIFPLMSQHLFFSTNFLWIKKYSNNYI